MNKTVVGVIVLILVAVIGGYYLWTRDRAETLPAAADTEAAANGTVIDPAGSVPETADLEAELNATGADTDTEMHSLEAEFEAGA